MPHPRRASKARLEGAPPYVAAVYDDGPKANDRYTVIFGWPLWEQSMGRSAPCLQFNECPTSPNFGISMWGEVSGAWGAKPIAWYDLPEHLQLHVIARANYPEKIKVFRLVRVGTDERVVFKPNGLDSRGVPKNRTVTRRSALWGFEPLDGVGYWGPTFESKSSAREYALSNLILLVK